MQDKGLLKSTSDLLNKLAKKRQSFSGNLSIEEIGFITRISTGIVRVEGLGKVGYEELIKFPNDVYGMAFNLDEDEIGVILLGDNKVLQTGDIVERTGMVLDVPVGEGLLGRIINPLGFPLDTLGPVKYKARLPIEQSAPPIMARLPVSKPLQTGIKVIDSLIPIGRGQRELILGDRQTGKTAIAIDTIINQKGQNVICIYCAIGQRGASVSNVVGKLHENGAMDYTIVMITEGNDAPGLKYIAPYAATSIAEYFMKNGKDVLIIYDDLTQHATAYREISLLLRRPPGREAFPGDIFYIHSRLLERATHLKEEHGGGSLTALPIIETEAQNLSAYIPTNLISITDGQVYLSPKLFELGVLPAIDIGESVSRVGSKAQKDIYQSVIGDLKLSFSQFQELEAFSRFGTKLDKTTKDIFRHGKRIRAIFKQEETKPLELERQVLILLALSERLFDQISLDKLKEAELLIIGTSLTENVQQIIKAGKKLSKDDKKTIVKELRSILSPLYTDTNQNKTAHE